jgi:hypothetical protein
MAGCWGKKGAGYEQRWPTDWRTYLKAKLNKTIVCVTELMDHVVAESIKAYAGTPRADDFSIFHGGLPAWWEALAQEHMASLGMANGRSTTSPPTSAPGTSSRSSATPPKFAAASTPTASPTSRLPS